MLGCVESNTSDQQLPGVTLSTIKVSLAANGRYSAEGIRKTVQRAVTEDDLVAWEDEDDNRRYTLATEPDLRRAATYAGERQLQSTVAWLNRCLAEVRGDG